LVDFIFGLTFALEFLSLKMDEFNDWGKDAGFSGRTWRQVEVRRDLNISHNLFTPRIVEADKYGNVYILDYGDLKVKKFSASGKFSLEFGKGKDPGPGEFINPTDIKVDDELNLWVSDVGNVKVVVFDKGGKLYKEFKLSAIPFRIAPIRGGGFIVQEIMEFKRYDADGRGLFGFKDEFILKKFDNPLFWSSYLRIDSLFLYCFLYDIGYLVCMDLKDGSVRYRVKIVDAPPPLEIVLMELKGAKVSKVVRKGDSFAVGFNVLGDKFFYILQRLMIKVKRVILQLLMFTLLLMGDIFIRSRFLRSSIVVILMVDIITGSRILLSQSGRFCSNSLMVYLIFEIGGDFGAETSPWVLRYN
jgi:hypothetical protein